MVTTADLLEAYYNCRKSKRKTASATNYEMDYESKLVALKERINNRTYSPGKSICFVVTRPRNREVFAATFEDRIIHHYIALRLEPLFEEIFSPRTFNCRKGKGQLYGVQMLKEDIRTCSNNYTTDCYIMKLDLKGFFMSIDKKLLAEKINKFVQDHYNGDDKDDLLYLCQVVIMHEPENNCDRHSPISFWDRLPPNKSLFTNGAGKGIAIGNLFAQLFANFLLNVLDWKLDEIGITYHGRYVDDIYNIHQDKKFLLSCVPIIRNTLAELGLQINEKKFYIQHYSKGVAFTGAVVKMNRVYAVNNTVSNFIKAVRRLNTVANINDLDGIRRAVSSVNSYLGLMRHYNEYGLRYKILNMLKAPAYKYVYIKGAHEVVALKNKYKEYNILLKRIRDGDY